MKKPNVCVLRTAGTNCDRETAYAFQLAGAATELVHINRFLDGAEKLERYHILALPGGFTYGDDIAAGRLMANELRFKLADSLRGFMDDGKLIIGICNGFQILVKAGLLPGNERLDQHPNQSDGLVSTFVQEASLVINDSGKFEDRWVYLKGASPFSGDARMKKRGGSLCVWTAGLPEVIYLPVAHGEGKFVVKDDTVLRRLRDNGQIVLRYCDKEGKKSGYPGNPNGSVDDIAAICDKKGLIIGMMPHPERHVTHEQHPRRQQNTVPGYGDGLQIFKNGVAFACSYL